MDSQSISAGGSVRTALLAAFTALLASCGDPSVDRSSGEDGWLQHPLFVNGGFESASFASWTKRSYLNPTGLAAVPRTTVAQLQLVDGGTDFTFARTNAAPQSQVPAGLAAGPGVPLWPRFGTTSAVINEFGPGNPPGFTQHQGANRNVNSIRQSFASTWADVDPADGKVHVRFVLAPQLEAAGHIPAQQPYFFVVVRNLTPGRAGDLYTNFNFANQLGVPWSSQGVGPTALLYTDWQIFDIAPNEDQFLVGDTLEVEVFAAGCQPSGHSGSAYVDGFGAQLASLAISKTAPQRANIDENITYNFTVQNNTSGIAPTVIADEVLPPNTTFVSLNAPGASCTAPDAGTAGTVSCTYGWMNPGASANFSVTVRNYPALGQGTTSTSAATRVDDLLQNWTANQFRGHTVYITSGAGAGQQRVITSNTNTRLNVTPAWTTNPAATNTFKILSPPAVSSTAANGAAADTLVGTQTWTSNQWLGWTVTIVGGTGAGQQATVTSNTANTLTVTPDWGTNPNNTSLYVLTQPVTTVTNGNYGVRGPTVSRLLGPKRETQLTNGVVYTDLSITTNDNVPAVIWGGSSTYAIRVVNNGPSAVTNALVRDTFPPELAAHTWTCAGAGGGTCTTPNGAVDINHTVTLPVGGSATFTVNATVIAGAGDGIISNIASVAAPAGVVDNFLSNNSDSDQNGVSPTLQMLTVTKDPAGTGQGRVTSSPSAINCGPACPSQSASFSNQPQVTLYAVAEPNNTFLGWTGDCSGSGLTCTLTMTAARSVTVHFTVCGNSALNPGEGCDDGNFNNGDGCNSVCKVETTFPCNANAAGAVGSASCASATCDATGGAPGICEPANTCGNGALESNEGCDDGNTVGTDGCSATCKLEVGRPCNAAAPGLTGSASCESTLCNTSGGAPGVCAATNFCSNSILEPTEGCDDGNLTPGDGCNGTCKLETNRPCNTASPGATNAASCASGLCDVSGGPPGTCELPNTCGNAALEAGEGCDDGNNTSGDNCSATCLLENNRPCNTNPAGASGSASCASTICDTTGGAPGLCEPANSCGNSAREATEGCDDGNLLSGDGCSSSCKLELGRPCNAASPGLTGSASCESTLCDTSGGAPGVCAATNFCSNSTLEPGEGCDDGNLVAGDGCNAVCKLETNRPCNTLPAGSTGGASCASGICDATGGPPGVCEAANTCGNSAREAGEGCDDGNLVAGDGCDAACKLENARPCNTASPGLTGSSSCASSVCDATLGAPGVCEPANSCGNAALEAAEGCDDGNTAAGDGCDATCKRELTRPCNADPSGATGSASCASGVCDTAGGAPGVCAPPAGCGNGTREATEGCDDGANVSGDGCNAGCRVETGTSCNAASPGLLAGASCASAVCDATGGAPGTCEAVNACGNGALEAGEGCDDGNSLAGDGCSSSCKAESATPCNGNASGVTGNGSCASGICDTVGNSAPGRCEAALTCGNARMETGEGCDDGNDAPGDGCSAACKSEAGRACNADAAGATGATSCESGVCDTTGGSPGVCEAANTCGNGTVEGREFCDDGNQDPGDGCNATCSRPAAGQFAGSGCGCSANSAADGSVFLFGLMLIGLFARRRKPSPKL